MKLIYVAHPFSGKQENVEKAEREKGCEHCDDDYCPRLNWHYGLDHILPGYKYCPMCGRKLDHEPEGGVRDADNTAQT